MARDTRQRILDASLAMFNAQGEPHVTTNHIADELEISPGNLYYHFRNKDDIIEQLFAVYEQRMDAALVAPSGRLPGLEDVWLQLHLVFECIWDYRFLYRDLVDILSRNRRLRMRFARILKRADEQAHRGGDLEPGVGAHFSPPASSSSDGSRGEVPLSACFASASFCFVANRATLTEPTKANMASTRATGRVRV